MAFFFQRFFQRVETAVLRHGSRPGTLYVLAALSVLDGFLPMLPAEMFVLALCVLQPHKGKVTVLLFAAASALSAFLLALGMGSLSTSAHELSQKLMGAQGPEALALVREWGPVSLVFFSVFPDSPRSWIALLALSGTAPETIAGMVFIGKGLLYAILLGLIHHLPSRVGRWRGAGPVWLRFVQRRASRFVAYCRQLRRRARRLRQEL